MTDSEFDPSVQDQYFSAIACAEAVCIDLDLSFAHYGNKILAWILRGLIEIKLDATPSNEIKRMLLPLTDVCTAQLPGDGYVDWIYIGGVRGQYFVKFGTEDSLVGLPRTTESWNPSQCLPPGWLPNGTDLSAYNGYAFANGGGVALPTLCGGLPQSGQFKIANGQIMFDAGLGIDSAYIEYIGLGISLCGETIIHPYFFEYCRAYAEHQHEKFRPIRDRSESAIARTGREAWHQEQKVRGRVFQITPTDLLKVSRRHYRLSNKA